MFWLVACRMKSGANAHGRKSERSLNHEQQVALPLVVGPGVEPGNFAKFGLDIRFLRLFNQTPRISYLLPIRLTGYSHRIAMPVRLTAEAWRDTIYST